LSTSPIQDEQGHPIAIRVRGLINQFGEKVVHKDLDLDVREGEIIGVIGPSGCGKSVLLRSIVGLITPKKADIEVFGVNLNETDRAGRRDIEQGWGVMFQDGALFSTLSVRENVMAPMREHLEDMPVSLMRELADMKISMVGLEPDAAGKRPSSLSGGMRKRAALARSIALDPRLLFLDEPTAGLDPISAGNFDTLLRGLADALNLTVFLVTHDLDSLGAVCDRVAVLNRGKVLAVGTLAEVRANPDPWIQDYFSGKRGRAALG
tara:strand:- start:375 stop:1166 length:792 start_codon:yes stop_codon:yes gene_type:complete